eukprot:7125344-Pyramimonas_sp.AAC.1
MNRRDVVSNGGDQGPGSVLIESVALGGVVQVGDGRKVSDPLEHLSCSTLNVVVRVWGVRWPLALLLQLCRAVHLDCVGKAECLGLDGGSRPRKKGAAA